MKVLLRRAGYPEGRPLPPLLIFWRDPDRCMGEEIALRLRRVGFTVRIEFFPPGDYDRAVEAGHPDLFRDGWIANYADPQDFLQLFYSGSP